MAAMLLRPASRVRLRVASHCQAPRRPFSASPTLAMKVVPVPVRADNYAYLLIDDASNNAAAVDPYDLQKVQAAAHAEGVTIVAAITTHHHDDHSGGNSAFAKAFPGLPVYGGSKLVPALTNLVKDKDEFTVGDIRVRCLATPCHTQDSICYYVTSTTGAAHPGGVFTGDTLFTSGCGRFFEGTGAEMHAALSYLAALPAETVVYNGHEYTASSLAFAKSVDPDNADLARLQGILAAHSNNTGLTTIGDERKWNPFMRLQSAPIREATGLAEDSEIMDKLRSLKNNFRG